MLGVARLPLPPSQTFWTRRPSAEWHSLPRAWLVYFKMASALQVEMCHELKLRLQAQSVSRSMDPGWAGDCRPGPGSSSALCDFGKSFTLSGTVGTLIPVTPSFPVLRMR